MINFIEFQGEKYPSFQSEGNASQFAIPFAKKFCSGYGVDIGFCKDDWKFPGAIGVDLTTEYSAFYLPDNLDYIYSSHCLEHLNNWVAAIEYWSTRLKDRGILFLYLPHKDQKYWNPWNNRKHLHLLEAKDVENCMLKFGFKNIIYSQRDLNHSFMIVGEKHG